MTGPEHYRLGENLTEQADAVMNYDNGIYRLMDTDERLRRRACLLAQAQVHMTAALAAATVLAGIILTLPENSRVAEEWIRVVGPIPLPGTIQPEWRPM